MWQIEILTKGAWNDAPIIYWGIFRFLFAAACILKFIVETRRGYFRYCEPNSYLEVLLRNKKYCSIIFRNYKLIYIVKWLSVLLLCIGICSQLSAFFLAVSFIVERYVYPKYHTDLFLLTALCLCVSADASSFFNYHQLLLLFNEIPISSVEVPTGNILPQIFLSFSIIILYISTALRKFRSLSFMNGTVITDTLKFCLEERNHRKAFDGWYPKIFLDFFVRPDFDLCCKRWAPLLLLSTVLELLVPFFLILNPLFLTGVIAGTVLHLFFALLFPATLAHFSLLMVFTYILFIDPGTWSSM